MKIIRSIFILAIAIPAVTVLVWYFAVPEGLLKAKIEESISTAGKGDISATLMNFRKGPFVSLSADSLDLSVDGIPALRITDISGRLSMEHLLGAELAFGLKGKIGTGSVSGLLKHPSEAEITIDGAELNQVPYLLHFGVRINGIISAKILVKDNDSNIVFRVPEMTMTEASSVIPFLDTFHRADGVVSISGNMVRVESIGLEGEKGYARVRGEIKNGVYDLSLELMPDSDRLSAVESMLIGKFQVSPGHYVIPVKGQLQ